MNLPNVLTLMRLAMVPLFPILYFRVGPLWGLGLYLLACATDVLDGYLARKWNQTTDFGKLADPLADKLMLLTALVCFAAEGSIPPWALCVVGVKEALMVVGGLILVRAKGIITPADSVGKVCTMMFGAAIVAQLVLSDLLVCLSHALAVTGGLCFVAYALVLPPAKWKTSPRASVTLVVVGAVFLVGSAVALALPEINKEVAFADILLALAVLLTLVSFFHYVKINWDKIRARVRG